MGSVHIRINRYKCLERHVHQFSHSSEGSKLNWYLLPLHTIWYGKYIYRINIFHKRTEHSKKANRMAAVAELHMISMCPRPLPWSPTNYQNIRNRITVPRRSRNVSQCYLVGIHRQALKQRRSIVLLLTQHISRLSATSGGGSGERPKYGFVFLLTWKEGVPLFKEKSGEKARVGSCRNYWIQLF